jgi:hypothetical protein
LAFSNWVRERQSAAEERNECCCSEGEFHGRKVLARCENFEETSCETMMRNFDDRLLSSVRRLRSILPSFLHQGDSQVAIRTRFKHHKPSDENKER